MVHKGTSMQLLQVSRLYRPLIVIGSALYLPSARVSYIFTVLYICLRKFCLHPSLYRLPFLGTFIFVFAFCDYFCGTKTSLATPELAL